MSSDLLDVIRKNDKNGFFETDASTVHYPSGFIGMDYYIGYNVFSYDKDDNFISSHSLIGVPAGSIITVFGKPASGKSTYASQIANNIVRPYKHGKVFHFDIERSGNITRIGNVCRIPISSFKNKYIFKQCETDINTLINKITTICAEKISNATQYNYNTGVLNEFGEEVIIQEPTVFIVDSVPSLTVSTGSEKGKKIDELEGLTVGGRNASYLSQFLKELLPYLKSSNSILILVNQVKDAPSIGPAKKAAQMLYLKQGESLPGGWSLIFYSSTIVRLTALNGEKKTIADDGYDGFGTHCQIIKSRTNSNGDVIPMVYDKHRGMDPLRSALVLAEELNLMEGNIAHKRFITNPDMKFHMRHVYEAFNSNKELYNIMYDNLRPTLQKKLDVLSREDVEYDDMIYNY